MVRTISGKYKINGISIPDPTTAAVTITPLQGEATGRTADGTMHVEVIHPGKRKVEIGYDKINKTQLSSILSEILAQNANGQQYFTFTYPDDPIESGSKTISCYGTPVGGELYSGVLYGGIWQNVKISCIER